MTTALMVVVVLVNFLVSQANIIGIDFASDSIKVAIVQPGTPLEIGIIGCAAIVMCAFPLADCAEVCPSFVLFSQQFSVKA